MDICIQVRANDQYLYLKDGFFFFSLTHFSFLSVLFYSIYEFLYFLIPSAIFPPTELFDRLRDWRFDQAKLAHAVVCGLNYGERE